MDRRRRRIAGLCIVSAFAVAWTGSWFGRQLIRVTYPEQLATAPAQDLPPGVDLAAVQRSWPGGIGTSVERSRLIGYMQNIDHQKPPVTAAVAQVPAAPAAPLVDLGTALASADANAGKSKAQVCMSCHDLSSGGPNKIGPNLWGVVGRNVASHAGFSYSPAMSGQQGEWTYERLDHFLTSPGKAVPGTKMGFAGFRDQKDRAAVIKYLSTLNDHPVPLPPPKPVVASKS
jgi:cytochrome c